MLTAVVIPKVSGKLVETMKASAKRKFHRRIGIATLLSGFGFVLAPIGIGEGSRQHELTFVFGLTLILLVSCSGSSGPTLPARPVVSA